MISLKLDVACGQNKQAGYKGIDIAGDADIVHDLNEYPWPIKKNSVTDIFCSHYVEHIPHWRPGWEKDGWWLFFDELMRICKKDAKLVFYHPYVKSDRAFWDPTHVRFIHELTWYYLEKQWRETQKLDHYDTIANFQVVVIQGTGMDQNVAARDHEFQEIARSRYWNVIPDLYVELKRL